MVRNIVESHAMIYHTSGFLTGFDAANGHNTLTYTHFHLSEILQWSGAEMYPVKRKVLNGGGFLTYGNRML